jgi:hypothetical protein
LVNFGEISRNWAKLGEIGRNWAKLGEIGRNWAKLGEIGRNWAKLGEIGRNMVDMYPYSSSSPASGSSIACLPVAFCCAFVENVGALFRLSSLALSANFYKFSILDNLDFG